MALLFSLLVLIVSAYFISQSSNAVQQAGIAVCFGLWVIVSVAVFRMNAKVERFRIQKG